MCREHKKKLATTEKKLKALQRKQKVGLKHLSSIFSQWLVSHDVSCDRKPSGWLGRRVGGSDASMSWSRALRG